MSATTRAKELLRRAESRTGWYPAFLQSVEAQNAIQEKAPATLAVAITLAEAATWSQGVSEHEIPHFPKRMDEMTEMEYEIAKVACAMAGDRQSVAAWCRKALAEWEGLFEKEADNE